MNRRDFLRPARLVEQIAKPPTAEEVALLRFSRRAMATTFEILLPFCTPNALDAANAALDEIDRLEAQLTIYRDNSEMTRLNRLASHTAIRVEDGLFELLTLAKTIHEETNGAHDITAGALVKAWGFFRGPARVPSQQEIDEALTKSGMRHVVLDANERSVRYLKPGLEINLGSIGKGYALDQAAHVLRHECGISSALLHGGQSSVYAIGSLPGASAWTINLAHPWDCERSLGTVQLCDQGLGTSAATFKHLVHQGRRLGHILDPRTGWPAEGMASVTVMAPTATQADALSTAFFVLGNEASRAYLDAHPDVRAILTISDASQKRSS